jgi:hypothetical protein
MDFSACGHQGSLRNRGSASYLGEVRIDILATARKHGVADEDILHALRNAVFDYPDQGDHELTMAVGPARNGVTMLEVGYLMSEEGRLVVVHAMRARRKYVERG